MVFQCKKHFFNPLKVRRKRMPETKKMEICLPFIISSKFMFLFDIKIRQIVDNVELSQLMELCLVILRKT